MYSVKTYNMFLPVSIHYIYNVLGKNI
jgi:hypothetical protein